MIAGKAVYDEEIVKLREELKARGIVLIVIRGLKNKSDIEFGSALTVEDIPRAATMLRLVAENFEKDFSTITQEYHTKDKGMVN